MDKFNKDPQAVLDYKIIWSTFLGTDTIQTSSWSLDSGNPDSALVIDSDENDDTESVVWLSGGTLGSTYIVTNHIVSVGGRENDCSIKIKIKNF